MDINRFSAQILDSFDNSEKHHLVQTLENYCMSIVSMSSLGKSFTEIVEECPISMVGNTYISESTLDLGNENRKKGLFAAVKFKRGDPITFYPSQIAALKEEDNGHGYQNCRIQINPKYEGKTRLTDEIYNEYSFDLNSSMSIFGDPDLVENTSTLGHIINDASCIKSTKETYTSNDLKQYVKEVLKKRNAVFMDIGNFNMIILAVATKDIEIGEEIFTSYNINYWLSKNTNIANNKKIVKMQIAKKVCSDVEKHTFEEKYDSDLDEYYVNKIRRWKSLPLDRKVLIKLYSGNMECGYVIFEKESIENNELGLNYFYLDPPFRNKGIFKRMMKTCLKTMSINIKMHPTSNFVDMFRKFEMEVEENSDFIKFTNVH